MVNNRKAYDLEGFWLVDLMGNLIQVNEAYAKISGYTIDELQHMHISQLEAIEGTEQIKSHIAKAFAHGSELFQTRHRCKDGHTIDIEISVTFQPELQQFCVFCRDISERKQREAQDREHLDELAHVSHLGLMQEMTSGIAHEVNQPLAAITCYTQASLNLINAKNPDRAKLKEILTKVQQQALKAGNIIHRSRQFVRSQPNQRSTFDINTLIHDAVNVCSAEIKQKEIKLTIELENDLPPIFVHPIQIEQILINLIRNSRDALLNLPETQARHISIHSELTPNEGIQVRVKDNGPGIDHEQQLKIMMPFYTTKTHTMGMGLGLAICRSIIKAHAGSFRFNSKPGKGSSFYFSLPTGIPSNG